MTRREDPRYLSRLVVGIVTALAALWTAGAVATPWLAAHHSVAAPWLRFAYRTGCHQLEHRCLDVGFGPFAVCARCTGLYVGGVVGLLWTAVRNRSCRPHPLVLVAVAVPTTLDFAAGQLGLPSAGNWTRFGLALPLGLVAGLYLGDALIDITLRNTVESSPRDSVQ